MIYCFSGFSKHRLAGIIEAMAVLLTLMMLSQVLLYLMLYFNTCLPEYSEYVRIPLLVFKNNFLSFFLVTKK